MREMNDFSQLKTDTSKLSQIDEKYSINESLEAEYTAICKDFQSLLIRYESLKQARKFIK